MQMLRQEIIKSGEHNIQQPVNLKRLLWNAQRVFDKEQGGKAQSSKTTMQSCLVCSTCLLALWSTKGVTGKTSAR